MLLLCFMTWNTTKQIYNTMITCFYARFETIDFFLEVTLRWMATTTKKDTIDLYITLIT